MEQAMPRRDDQNSDLFALIAAIERSPIYVRVPENRLPAGFDAHDVAVLDWIVAQARASRHAYVNM